MLTFDVSSGPRTAASGISDSTSERSCVMRYLRASDNEEVVVNSIDSVHNYFVLIINMPTSVPNDISSWTTSRNTSDNT